MQIILGQKEILQLLPSRYPFLLVDRVIELEPGKRGIGVKNVTINEPYFVGHFPQDPIMPGVLIVDACAQMTAIVCATVGLFDENGRYVYVDKAAGLTGQTPSIGYLGAINRFKFTQTVIPGDQLILESVISKRVGNLLYASVNAKVESQIVAEGSLIVGNRNG